MMGTLIYICLIVRPAALWIVKNTPEGRPDLLVQKLRIVTVFFMPLHMGIVGYKTDIHKVSFVYLWRVLLNTFAAANTLMVLALVVQVAVITPTVKYLYDPSSKYLAYKGRNYQTQASNPTKLHPLTVYLLHLIELVGRATPLLIAHPMHKRVSTSNPTKSEIIINVFQQFQNRHQHLVTVHPFSTISPYASMHNDICSMSVDNRTALIIFPFCRQDVVSKREDLDRQNISSRSIKTILQNLLRNSPCSVGILIDGSNPQTKSTCFLPDTPYRVTVLFFGGPDDREALAIAMNMIHHPSVLVTLVRYYGPARLSSDEVIDYGSESVGIDVGRQKFLDDELVDHFRVNSMHEETLMYKEVEVKDGAETIWSVRSLREDIDLMLVGRQQISDSKIVSELDTNWAECEELGAVGDMVTSPDYDAEGSILLIHQRLVVSSSSKR
ncbi:hypothetical protein C5167_044885 [Papaver somniferum]|uniref:Cation/H+ exchanger domain-containing protein n=1 Tax=Papaver somniferum TaxID=3469 RepID=A0A4Y7LA31_PAPSO|nr:hypothetical protein C5167_044885 [Papaver somniferum]